MDGWSLGWMSDWMEQKRSVSIFGLFFTGEILIKVMCNEHTICGIKRD